MGNHKRSNKTTTQSEVGYESRNEEDPNTKKEQPKVSTQELTQYEKDEKVFTRQAMDDKYGLGDYDEWEFKVLLRFDARPDGVHDYLSHDLFKLTKPEWIDFLGSSKYELLDDDPTMIWEDSETHETWVLFDPRFLKTGEHLNKTENQSVSHSVHIKTQFCSNDGKVKEWRTLSRTTHSCLTRLDAAVLAFSNHFQVSEDFIRKEVVIEEEDDYFGTYYFAHMNIQYYIHVYRDHK